ncbi:hypothetical protein M8494_10410 [Serratia ureilytica]
MFIIGDRLPLEERFSAAIAAQATEFAGSNDARKRHRGGALYQQHHRPRQRGRS